MTQAELERRLLALERRVPGGTGSGYAVPPGLSTLFGVATQNYRDRFPAILTSTFDSTTGYSWARLVLDRTASSPGLVEVANPQAGAYAFTPSNNQDLQIGDRGWLEADPNAAGWIFLPDASAGAGVACGELNAGLDTDECLHLYVHAVSGKCSTIDTTQETWLEHDAGAWKATSTLGGPQFDHTGSGTDPADVVFGFTNGVPYLTIDGVYGTPQGCSDGGLLFSFGGATLCAGGTDTDCANYFVVQVKCGCCPITDWDGVGWYCVVGSDETCNVDTGACVYLKLSDASACDTEIKICGGPYDTEEDCAAACVPATVEVACCPDNDFPETMELEFQNDGTGTATCLNGLVYSLPWNGSTLWQFAPFGTADLCGNTGELFVTPCQSEMDTFSLDGPWSDPGGLVGTQSNIDCGARTVTFSCVVTGGTITAIFRPA